MLVLGIETSCDETAIAIIKLENDGKIQIIAEEVSSQIDLHKAYGGVVPELASREHLKNLPLLYSKILTDSKLELREIDGIAVTRGPGLKGCLLMGYSFAKGLSISADKPFIGVNHIEGHILAPLLDNPDLKFPFLSLVVSGGHTEILEVNQIGDYKLIARTIDDAAGEAFDKSAHLLGFEYPGGPKLAELADSFLNYKQSTKYNFVLPKVMREAEGFSFSGLKTAISQLINKHKNEIDLNPMLKAELAYTIQHSIVDSLVFKLKNALQNSKIKTISITGGVSANKYLRAEASKLGVNCYFPNMNHCIDNAAMIALVGAYRLSAKQADLYTNGVISRWPVESLQKTAA
ncbi:MAG: tRNA (adenosine(37)-N6)-threonylcarbamoyltransferase complex transferase subunit TsaD [Bdellovibrionales bacterium]|nr:tRNA (adenosine(37)-N6)-threonylcarbamoyltransferase complex transferase subunit TsaD [Bdellovibrionales bacterium]